MNRRDPPFDTFWGGFFVLTGRFIVGFIVGVPLAFFFIPLLHSLVK
jgi:hypothetical protein